MGTDAEDLYAKQATAFHAEDAERDFTDAQDLPFYKELRQFLGDDLGLSVGERDFKELWYLGYNLNCTHDELKVTSANKKITGKEHDVLVRAAEKMVSQLDQHREFLANYIMFPNEQSHNKKLAISKKTLEMVAKVGREISRPDHSKNGEELNGDIENTIPLPDYAELRDEYILRLAGWWKRVAGSAPTYGRERAPFVRLCKELMPGSRISFQTVRRALKPAKKTIKGRGKSTIPERKKYRAVGT